MRTDNFKCFEWTGFGAKCAEQCEMCKEKQPVRWIDIEDGQGSNEVN